MFFLSRLVFDEINHAFVDAVWRFFEFFDLKVHLNEQCLRHILIYITVLCLLSELFVTRI